MKCLGEMNEAIIYGGGGGGRLGLRPMWFAFIIYKKMTH